MAGTGVIVCRFNVEKGEDLATLATFNITGYFIGGGFFSIPKIACSPQILFLFIHQDPLIATQELIHCFAYICVSASDENICHCVYGAKGVKDIETKLASLILSFRSLSPL
jgi:hypothetical protein